VQLYVDVTDDVPVGDCTACRGTMSSGSWTRLSSSPSASNCISWRVLYDVTRRRVDVTDSVHGMSVSVKDCGSQLVCVPSDDSSQIHPSSATYTRDVLSQATMSRGDLKSLTTMSVSLWRDVELNFEIVDNQWRPEDWQQIM